MTQIGYHSTFMDRIIERAEERQKRTEKMIEKMLNKSEVILQAGKEPMTNEEYIRSLNTEQLIRFLLWYPYNVHGYPKPKMSIAEEEDAIRKWLKEKHNG